MWNIIWYHCFESFIQAISHSFVWRIIIHRFNESETIFTASWVRFKSRHININKQLWLFQLFLYGKNRNSLNCLAKNDWRVVYACVYTFNYTTVYSFFFLLLLFSGLSFALPIFSCVWNFSMRHVLFLRENPSILYISHHATAGEYVYIRTRMNTEEKRKKVKERREEEKKNNEETTKTVYLRKPEEKMKQWCN